MKKHHPKTKFKIGTYQLGYRWVDLFADPTAEGARFNSMPDGKRHASITVGMGYTSSGRPWGHLIHEVVEFALSEIRGRFVYSDVFDDRATDTVVFHFDHNQLNELAARVGWFAQKCLRDFEKAYRRCHRKQA